MLNGLEKTLERKLPMKERRWQVSEKLNTYKTESESGFRGWPATAN